ncbi:receptor-type tyrosine-protein kinase FLT3-like [Microplitis mediator]|uniref:receptor-type tyrosine-protein kinase FLT3-like n=1 Tax=Microplitis mediator TaxID=375433 RepID=UPI0025545E5C|nr:receptor-type tyrosine-protein kinase FLT3-like [Microplitis mediator]
MFYKFEKSIIFLTNIIIFIKNFNVINTSIINNVSGGAPRNLIVEIFDELRNINDDNSYHSVLKFNISWLPPQYPWHPSSYSIFINSITNKNNEISCPEESSFYTTPSDSQLSIVLPENSFFSDVPELKIRPSCQYEIQVFANPRINAYSNAAKINVTVPNCVGNLCNCDESSKLLPLLRVNAAVIDSNKILITWSIISNNSTFSTFVIGYSVPILMSKNGIPVFNLTKLDNVSSSTFSYQWNTESKLIINNEIKIFVVAEDPHGCRGRMSDFIIKGNMSITTYSKSLIWSTVVIICLIIIGLFLYLLNRGHENYKFILLNHVTSGINNIRISDGSGWINSILKNKNILYADQFIETPENTTDNYEISYDRIKILNQLGNGQFGKVYFGYLDSDINNNENGFPIAVKMTNPLNFIDKTEARREFFDEITTMKRAGFHPHLVKLIGCCTKLDNPICIILEYIEGGDLLSYLHQLRDRTDKKVTTTTATFKSVATESLHETSNRSVSPIGDIFSISPSASATNSITFQDNNNHSYTNVQYQNRIGKKINHSTGGTIDNYRFINFAMDIAQGMAHLEKKYIVHRDLAARNVLVTSNLTLKVSDFGLSRDGIYIIGQSGNGVRRLPVRWMAPEALRDRAFTSKSDVWSYAVVLWEILTLGAFPYSEIQDEKLLQYIVENNCRLKCPNNISTEFNHFMNTCWSSQAAMRPNFIEIIKQLNSFYNRINTSISNPSYTISLHFN